MAAYWWITGLNGDRVLLAGAGEPAVVVACAGCAPGCGFTAAAAAGGGGK
jgi:hypothetical protein